MVADATGLIESRLAEAGFTRVGGADEVGRGALAGPLFAAAVVLPVDAEIPGLRDSKLCTKKQRLDLAERIKDVAFSYSVVKVRHSTIDEKGLNPANLRALRSALNSLEVEPQYILVDYFRLKRMPCPTLGVKKGDGVSKAVAAASILAKVERDAAMGRYHRRFPRYGFKTNAGYGTRYHWNALKQYGPSPVHRRSFYGVTGFRDENGVIQPHVARDLQGNDLNEEEDR
ncbi:MAG: ribonuclease HII [Actinomycetota bacterium]